MTQKEIISLLQQGEEITITRQPKQRLGSLYLSVETSFTIGKHHITKANFEAVREKQKLVKNYEKSSPAISVYKLSSL